MNQNMLNHPIKFFHDHKIKPRSMQIDVIEKVYNNWNKYRYFVLNCPTGTGKTYIATSIADSVDRAYMLTSTLSLQDQYMKSWPELINLKGRGNYTCAVNSSFTVDAAPCSANPELYNQCKRNHICPYINQKVKALESDAMITNPVYMLYSAHCGVVSDDESPWTKRDVMIVDEAHNLEDHLVSFSESDIDPEKLHHDFGVATDGITFSGDSADDYFKISTIRDILKLKAIELKEKLEEEFPKAKLVGLDQREWAKGFNNKTAERVKKLNSKIYQLDKSIQPLNIFFNTHETEAELTTRWIVSKHKDANILKLSPIYGDFLFHEYFGKLADKFVFLSATMGTKHEFCKELGIDETECLFLETDSPFNPDKSPIIVMPSIKLSKDNYDINVKKVGKLVDDIMDMHPGLRGICHSVTYDIAKHIYSDVNSKNRKRLLCRDMDILSNTTCKNQYPKKYKNDELLQIHKDNGSSYGSVLLSPSMMEGIDLHDDLSEFQIIIKLPWANLGDIRVKTKSKMNAEWYTNKMWLAILQASGRSTRHEEDTSVTYILDENFKFFYKQWETKLPGWFKKRLIF